MAKGEERDLVELIVAELRRQRDLVGVIPATGRVIVHVNRGSKERPVELELQFKA